MSLEHFRAALDRTLASAAADERIGPRIGASGVSLRLRLTDCDLVLDVVSEQAGHNISWSFRADPALRPRLELEMDTVTANRFLQGRESLAIAIAHRRARVRSEGGAAVAYLPATELLREPYLRIVESEFPDLLEAGIDSRTGAA